MTGSGVLVPKHANGSDEGDNIVMTAEEISAMNAHKMADVLNHVPGVSVGNRSVSIHGSTKVKVFVDGRPINDPTSSYGAINWELVSPDEVERIEILRDKGGLRYGQDASGGVILITTRRTRDVDGNIKAYCGSHETRYGYANMQIAAGKWTAGATGGVETTDGYKINNDKKRYQAGARLSYAFDDRKDVTFLADFLKDDKGSSGLPEYPTPYSRKTSRTTGLSLQANYNCLNSAAFYNESRNHNKDISRGLDHKLRVSEWGEDLVTSASTENWGKVNYGAGYRQGKASGSTFDDQKEGTFSVFIAQSLQWSGSPLSLAMGLRANFNSDFDDAVNPEIKTTYKKNRWHLTAAYGRTNNTPSFRKRFNQTSSTRPNPDLDMETADNYSLTYFIEPSEFLSCTFSLFHNRLNDRITYVIGDDGIGQYQNFGLVTYTGGDFAVSWKPLTDVKIKGSCMYLEAKDKETDLWLPGKARRKAIMDIYWTPCRPISIVLSGKHVSEIYRNKSNTKTLPEYTLMGFRTEYGFKRFSIFAEVKNIFDRTYYYGEGLLAPPRTWMIGTNWRI